MVTFKSEVRNDHKRQDGTYSVRIRITHNRVVRRIPTSIYVTKDDITKGFKIKNQSILDELDNIISTYRSKCNTLSLLINDMDIDELIGHITKTDEGSLKVDFIEYARKWVDDNRDKHGISVYSCAINSLIKFLGREKLDFKEINYKFLKSYEEYLGQRRALSLYMGAIRHLHNEAKREYNDEEAGNIKIPWSPFTKYSIPNIVCTRERALDVDTIRAIYNLPYILTKDGKEKDCRFNFAKDMFILSFCLMGMNSADLFLCDTISESKGVFTITYNRAKTSTRRTDKAKISVSIHPFLMPIYEKYKDPSGHRVFRLYKKYSTYNRVNVAINVGLKQIGKVLGIDDLEFYAARHSFASIARNDLKVDKSTVGEALNHVDKENKITDIYIKKDFSVINDVNSKVIEYVFEEKTS
jgi:hypothetical protein